VSYREIAPVLFAVLAGLSTAIAQTAAPSEGRASGVVATAQGETTASTTRSIREPARDADARLCLEFATNEQVIMCAEKYRPGRRRS